MYFGLSFRTTLNLFRRTICLGKQLAKPAVEVFSSFLIKNNAPDFLSTDKVEQ